MPNSHSAEECFEGTSRAMFKFNMALDNAVLEPIAKGYNKLPSPIRTGTSNFTSNIGTLLSIPNTASDESPLYGFTKMLRQKRATFIVKVSDVLWSYQFLHGIKTWVWNEGGILSQNRSIVIHGIIEFIHHLILRGPNLNPCILE